MKLQVGIVLVCGVFACDSNGAGPVNVSSRFITGIFPKDITGTWLELGPDIAVSLDFAEDRSVTFNEVSRFTLDGESQLQNVRVIPSAGADATTFDIVLTKDNLAAGSHAVVLQFRDSDGNEHGAEWEFSVVNEGDVSYVSPADESDYIQGVTPPEGTSGSWQELGPLIEVRYGSPLGIGPFLAFQVDDVDRLGETSGVILENSATKHLELVTLAPGSHEVKASFTRPPDLNQIHRVAWGFVVTE